MSQEVQNDRLRVQGEGIDVSALWTRPSAPSPALLVLGHGAGSGMEHPHLERLTHLLAQQNLGTLRFQFPYRERGSGRPDPARVLESTVRAAVATAQEIAPAQPVFLGGRSMGARMAVRAHVAHTQPVRGFVFYAFPLHRPVNLNADDPTLERAEHLFAVDLPMLFFSGTRDRLCRPHLLRTVLERCPTATLRSIETGDHGFVPTKKSGRTLADIEAELAETTAAWVTDQLS